MPHVLRVAELSGAALIALLVVAAVTGPLTVQHAFDGSWALGGSLLASLAAMWLVYLVRGLLAGVTRFRQYGVQLAAEGAFRVVGVVAFALAGVRSPGWYGVLLVAPIPLSVLLTGRGLVAQLTEGREGPRDEQGAAAGAGRIEQLDQSLDLDGPGVPAGARLGRGLNLRHPMRPPIARHWTRHPG